MNDPPSRSSRSKPANVRPAAGRPPGPEDEPRHDDWVEISSKATSSGVDVDKSQALMFTTGFRRAVLSLEPGAAAAHDAGSIEIRSETSRDDPTLPSARRSGGSATPEAPTPVEPSRARFKARRYRRSVLIVAFAVLGAVTALVLLREPERDAARRPEISTLKPEPKPARVADPVVERSNPLPGSTSAPAAAAPSVPRAAAPSNRARTAVPAGAAPSGREFAPKAPVPGSSQDGLWFPPE